jgi:hypothetical protein
MISLKYTDNSFDQKDLLTQAWKLISFTGANAEKIVNLRNLIILILGIENIFLDSMLNPDKSENQTKSMRNIGYFVG